MRSFFCFLFFIYANCPFAHSFSCEGVISTESSEHRLQPKTALVKKLISQGIDSNQRAAWRKIWETIPKRNYLAKLSNLKDSSPTQYLHFQSERISFSHTIYNDPSKLAEWNSLDIHARNLTDYGGDLSLKLMIFLNGSLTTHYKNSDKSENHGRLRSRDREDDFDRLDPNFITYKALDVHNGIKELLYWYHEHKMTTHPIELATVFYQRFTTIHPFMDGNGRTGMLLVGLILIKNGYPPPIFAEGNIMMNRSYKPGRDVTLQESIRKMTGGIANAAGMLNSL